MFISEYVISKVINVKQSSGIKKTFKINELQHWTSKCVIRQGFQFVNNFWIPTIWTNRETQ